MRYVLLLLLLAAVALAAPTAGEAAPVSKGHQICVGGPTCFPTLAAALAAAHDGDTVQLGPGVYTGGVTIDSSIDLVGAGAGKTIIKGGGPVLTLGVAGEPNNDQLQVSISGVTVTGGVTTSQWTPDGITTTGAAGGGIEIPGDFGGSGTVGATVTIRNSAISGNRATPTTTFDSGDPSCPGGDCPFAQAEGGGIDEVGVLTLINTVVSNNLAGGPVATDADGGGISTATNGGPGVLTLIDSTVTNNQASVSPPNGQHAIGAGIFVQDGEAFDVENSTVSDNTASVVSDYPTGVGMLAFAAGIHIGGYGSATIENSRITGNTASVDDPSGFPNAFDAGLIEGDNGAGGETFLLQNTVISDNHTIANVASSDNGPTDSALEIDGPATVSGTTISDNSTTVTSHHGSAQALGTFFSFDFDSGKIVMSDSKIINNIVTVSGHGGPATIQGAGLTNGFELELHNVQISGNSAHVTGPAGSYGQGGGIWNGQPFGPGSSTPQLTLDRTQVTQNQLTGSPGVLLQGGGLFTAGFLATLTNSNISQNRPDQCYGC